MSANTAWPKGVIFDLNGTLVDSAEDIAAALNAALGGLGTFRAPEVATMVGEGARALVRKALLARAQPVSSETVDDLHRRFATAYVSAPLKATRSFPGAREILSALASGATRIGVCTNKAERSAGLVLERTGLLPYVGAVVGGDSGYGFKPDPAPLIACAAKLGLATTDVVFVGDHPIDVETARAARVPVVVVEFGYGAASAASRADGSIGLLRELPAAIADLAQQRSSRPR